MSTIFSFVDKSSFVKLNSGRETKENVSVYCSVGTEKESVCHFVLVTRRHTSTAVPQGSFFGSFSRKYLH